MCLKLDVNGINVELEIRGYRPDNKRFNDDAWCKCDFSLYNENINYSRSSAEVLFSAEVDLLESYLTRLLNGEIKEIEEFLCAEPDFEFYFHPEKQTLRPDYVFAIFVEWKINFWHERSPSGNSLTLTLWQDEIIALKDYLSSVIKRKNKSAK